MGPYGWDLVAGTRVGLSRPPKKPIDKIKILTFFHFSPLLQLRETKAFFSFCGLLRFPPRGTPTPPPPSLFSILLWAMLETSMPPKVEKKKERGEGGCDVVRTELSSSFFFLTLFSVSSLFLFS
jgi:hypothetical protein